MARPTFRGIIAVLLALALLPWSAPIGVAAPAHAQRPLTAPCYTAAIAALTKRGAIYSQGGTLPNDPINPATGQPYPRTGPSSFDCSGLIWWSYAQAGVTVGTTTYAQVNNGTPINCTLADLHGSTTTCWTLGDLIFLAHNGGQHVAIYVGSGLFMDCYNHAVGCVLHDVTRDSFYAAHFWQARRIVSGCEGLTTNPGQPVPTPASSPDLEAIPDLLGYVAFVIPQCGDCGNGQTGQPALVHQPPPETVWYDLGSVIQWLAWSIEDTMIDVLCWLVSLLQLLVNIVAQIANVFITAINQVWKFLIFAWLTVRAMFYAAWGGFEQVRDFFQQVVPFLMLAAAWLQALLSLLLSALQLAGQALTLLVQLALALLGLLGWIGGLALGLISAISVGLGATTTPAPLAATNHVVYGMVRGSLEALHDSQLGWMLYLGYGLAYIGFVVWLSRFLSASREA
jgi:hypothetical protein